MAITVISSPDNTEQLHKFGGDIWYVNKGSGADTNTGITPDTAFETIGAAITAMSAGDGMSVAAGTYVETGIDLNVASTKIWFEHGVIIDPATGTALTVSAANCLLECPNGSVKITPATNTTGVLVSGAFCYVNDIRVSCFETDEANSADIGFDITGNGNVLTNCRASSPDIAAFKIQGDKTRLKECCTGGGNGGTAFSSIGFWFTNSCNKARVTGCGSQGHGTAGFQVDTGCTNGVIEDVYSGGGDGKWTDPDHAFVWSNFHYDSEIFSTSTFVGGTTEFNLFKVTGAVRITDFYGHVKTVIPAVNSTMYLQLYSTGGTVDITDAPGVQINGAVAGAMFIRNEDSTNSLMKADPNGTPAIVESTTYKDPKVPIDIVKDNGADTYVRVVLSVAEASGAISWHCHWEPLTNAGFLEAV